VSHEGLAAKGVASAKAPDLTGLVGPMDAYGKVVLRERLLNVGLRLFHDTAAMTTMTQS